MAALWSVPTTGTDASPAARPGSEDSDPAPGSGSEEPTRTGRVKSPSSAALPQRIPHRPDQAEPPYRRLRRPPHRSARPLRDRTAEEAEVHQKETGDTA